MRKYLGALVLLTLTGCNRDESKLRTQAEWLCRYNQLGEPNLRVLPGDEKPADYIRKEDLDYVKEQEAANDNALAQGMIAALTPAMVALSEGMAKHTKCEVDAITVQGDAATLTVKITRPELEQASAFAKLGELAKAETPEARRDKVEEWVKASTKTTTATHSVQFVKTPEGWRANFDLKARAEAKKREQALAELQQLREKKAQATKVQAELSKFAVSQPRFYKKKQMFGVKPIIEMSVQNGTAHAISRVVMKGTLASPGRSVPWHQDTFNYAIPGGLEAGESANWALELNMFSEWAKVEGAPDMVLLVEVLRLDGADGKPLYVMDFTQEDMTRLGALEASLGQ